MTAHDVYTATVLGLPASERLRLATMILEGLAETADALDYSDRWSDEDVEDIAAFSSQHASDSFTDEPS